MAKEAKHKMYSLSTAGGKAGSQFVPYENLANAIIKKAVRDYQRSLIELHLNPNDVKAEAREREVQVFFKGSWYKVLTGMDPIKLLKMARKQVEDNGWKRFDMSQD